MLEIIALIFLSRKIGALAVTKGLRPGPWKLRLVLFWILGEFIGIIIGFQIFGTDGLFGAILLGIAAAVSSYFIINNYLSKLPNTMDDDINNIGQR